MWGEVLGAQDCRVCLIMPFSSTSGNLRLSQLGYKPTASKKVKPGLGIMGAKSYH